MGMHRLLWIPMGLGGCCSVLYRIIIYILHIFLHQETPSTCVLCKGGVGLAIVMGVGTCHHHCCLPVMVLLPIVVLPSLSSHCCCCPIVVLLLLFPCCHVPPPLLSCPPLSSSLFHPQSTPWAVAHEAGHRWCVVMCPVLVVVAYPLLSSIIVVILSLSFHPCCCPIIGVPVIVVVLLFFCHCHSPVVVSPPPPIIVPPEIHPTSSCLWGWAQVVCCPSLLFIVIVCWAY
jgi:hypothetical protein